MTAPYTDPDSVHVPTVGGSPPATWGTVVRDNLETLARAPGCQVKTTGAPVIASGATSVWTTVSYGGADLRDTDNFHSPTVNPSRMTVPAGLGGWYRLSGQVTIGANAAGYRNCRALVNGTAAYPAAYMPLTGSATTPVVLPISMDLMLAAGDYVEVQVQQNSGSGLTATSIVALTLVAWP